MSQKNVPINTKITLSDIEQEIVQNIASKRFTNNRKSHIINSKIGSQSNEQTDIEGFGAELAFCKAHNVYPDFSVYTRKSFDDSGDAVLHIKCGIVDVKGTQHETGRLITPTWKNKNTVNLYALMIGKFPNYIFKGFMRAEDFMVEKRKGDLGYGKESYIANQDELKDIDAIINMNKDTDKVTSNEIQ